MDSLSQIVLGAGVCGLVARQPLRRSLLYGAALGTLPDLDYLLLGHLDPLQQFVRHRSFSHSLLVLSVVAPLLAWLTRRFDAALRQLPAARWWVAVWLVLVTHPLLDACTTYGTQLWWPLMPPPTAWNIVFIIDPLYTLPLLVACVIAWRRAADPRSATAARRALLVGAAIAHGYLLFGLAARAYVEAQADAILAQRGVAVERLLVTPAPFTTLLWRVLIRTPEGHAEAWYSLLRPDAGQLHPVHVAGPAPAVGALPQVPDLETLRWFTDGFLKVERVGSRLRASDLRMGADPDYFFSFDLAQRSGQGWRAITPQQVVSLRPRQQRLRVIGEHL